MRTFKSSSIPRPQLEGSWSEIFKTQPLDIEIGAGQGLHSIRYAQSNPGRTLIAIERTHERFQSLNRRRNTHPNLKNLYPLHADAISIFTHYILDNSIERIFLLYPNPYPKAKQSNLRWYNMPFMELLRTKLNKSGKLVLATNIETYAKESAERIPANWRLNLIENLKLQQDIEPRTHFERKYLARGESCWNLVFQKP